MVSLPLRARRLSLFSHVLWLFIGIVLWAGRQVWEWKQGVDFSLMIFAKGFVLLWLVAIIYGETCRRRPGFLFLGFFPLIWLSVSTLQWNLCAQSDERYWIWLGLFLLLEFFLMALSNGRWLLGVVSVLGATMSVLFPFSLPVFLSFGWVSDSRYLKNGRWAVWGLPVVGLILFFAVKGQEFAHFFIYDLFQILFNDHFLAFLLLGLLGLFAVGSKRHRWTPAFGPLVFLCVGFFFLSGPDYFSPLKQELLKWVLVFYAGFGWESFRRDMMDRSWHGRLLWVLVGFAFLGGVWQG